MSKLELLIIQCRRVWEETGFTYEEIDDMIETFAGTRELDLSKITDDLIKEVTKLYKESKNGNKE